YPTRQHEFAFALMMNCSRLFLRWSNPGLDDFQNEEVVFRDQLHIHDLTFQAGVTFGNERSLNPFGSHG
ncbi:MAG: hypothetical protein RL616_2555, partial [Verrucomicrobiota bacterium]